MSKYFLLLFFISCRFSFAQDDQKEKDFRSVLFSSLHVLPSDSVNKVYYTYKIAYNRLVFEKTGSTYTSKFTIAVEVFDKGENFIVRNSSDKIIELSDYEQTNSRNTYIEGLVEFKLGKGEFNIIPILTDLNSGREIKLKPVYLVTSAPTDSEILNPIIINANSISCSGTSYTMLTNFEENFPFVSEELFLVIPVTDTSVSDLKVNIINNQDTIFSGIVSESYVSNINMENCEDRIIIKDSKALPRTKNFIIKNFSNKLNVGNILMTVFKNKNHKASDKPDKTYQKAVVWYDKPYSLNDPESAIKSLKFIEEDSTINKLLKEKSEKYQEVLFGYWKKYDPTPATAFNELMNEYYQRVDYAAMNFSSINGKKGIDSDRGKVLITFGKPFRIERTSNEFGKIVETWVYENPQRKFIFVDQKGTGDFSLTKG